MKLALNALLGYGPANTMRVRCVLPILFLAAIDGRSDVLIGTNGERFVGKIIQETSDTVIFDSELGGRQTIPRARIMELQRDSPLDVSSTPFPATASTSGMTATNAAALTNLSWRPPSVGDDGFDWVQLQSGEWLKGRLKYIQERKVEFDSDELKDLSLDLKDVRQVYPAKPMFTKFNRRNQIFGKVVVSNDVVEVLGPERVILPRKDLTGITPGGKREIEFWSGKANVGVNFLSGNTRQVTETASAELSRRTPATAVQLNYLGNFSEVNGVQNANNHRVNGNYDIRLSQEWFLRPAHLEYYRDQVANVALRGTAGVGLGYLPFVFVENATGAHRLSNAIAIGMLFLTGYAFGRCTGYHPRGMGLVMVVIGGVMVGLTILLGG